MEEGWSAERGMVGNDGKREVWEAYVIAGLFSGVVQATFVVFICVVDQFLSSPSQ